MKSAPTLEQLRTAVADARRGLALTGGPGTAVDRDQYLLVSTARHDLIAAMEALHSRLVAAKRAVPIRLRDDLRGTRTAVPHRELAAP